MACPTYGRCVAGGVMMSRRSGLHSSSISSIDAKARAMPYCRAAASPFSAFRLAMPTISTPGIACQPSIWNRLKKPAPTMATRNPFMASALV